MEPDIVTAEDTRPAPKPTAAGAFVWTRAHTVILVLLCLANMLEALDLTVVNVALPTLKNDLGFSQSSLQWVVNGYTVVFGGFLLLGGRAGDLLGRRRTFLGGIALFTAASLASGLAHNSGTLIGARAVQGLAAAFYTPMTLAMAATTFPDGKPRNKALGIIGATVGISTSLGVTVGGLLVSGPGWRWIFFINIPVGLVVLAAGWKYLRPEPAQHKHRRFDLVGSVTVTAGVGLLAYAAVQTNTHPWGSGRTISLLIIAVALLVYFAVHETRIAVEPVVPFSIFRNRAVSGASIVNILVNSGMLAVFFFITLYEQEVLHYSAVRTGVTYLPLSLSMMAFAGLASVLVPKIGVRWTTAIGCAVAAVGLALFAQATPNGGAFGDIIGPSLVLGPGMALTFIPLMIAGVSGVDRQETGLASGLSNVTRSVGGALGLAVIAALAADRTNTLFAQGHTATALSDGLRFGFMLGSFALIAAVIAAIALFRDEGRGEKVDFNALASMAIEEDTTATTDADAAQATV